MVLNVHRNHTRHITDVEGAGGGGVWRWGGKGDYIPIATLLPPE